MNEKNILNNKYFLYVTEFFSGMSVMAVELGASRLMAPYFSSSQIVWTVIIGVIMIAMALGNVWGGRLADKFPFPGQALWKAFACRRLDCPNPICRQILNWGHLIASRGIYHEKFSGMGRPFRLPCCIRLPLRAAWDSHPFPGKILCQQP